MAKSPEYKAAEIDKMAAEAAEARARTAQAVIDAERSQVYLDEARALNRLQDIRLLKAEEEEGQRLASDYHNRTYRFFSDIREASARNAASTLTEWSRLDPGCEIEFVIDSPGGDIIATLHLFDVMRDLSAKGHRITTRALGMAASGGGVLLQAGDHRVMSPRASLLIHEASFGSGGSFGQVEDQVKFVEKLQDRMLDIYAERSSLSKTQIKNKWKRTNWWMDSKEAHKHGFCDEIA
jgi:ATP-dependent Clp endopeptidase proteolytic subunit ClpP